MDTDEKYAASMGAPPHRESRIDAVIARLTEERNTLLAHLRAAEAVCEAADVFVDSSPYGQRYNRQRQVLIGALAAWRDAAKGR